MEQIIKIENLSFSYPDSGEPAIKNLSLEIERGSFVAVLGHNGSGKSTLAKHLNAILLPSEGKVLVSGMDSSDYDNLIQIRRMVGMVFQNPDNQIVANVVEDDVAFAPENLGVPSEEIRLRVDRALDAVKMGEFKKHAPHLLSGGQKQRIAIAGVIAMEPEVLVLDEPTAMLDPSGREEVLKILIELNRSLGITVILITHHMEECIDADRLIVMSEGEIVSDGSPKKVFSEPERLYAEGLSVPDTTALLHELNQNGFSLPLDGLDINFCVEAIASQLGKPKNGK
ncbi:energy-coupling factor transporter ATPase [Clostridiaceae bacterium OttesenSCG-928-D20]|nr:energy-coupling factor transporter ATPase [Clostridiaceae bacterium OttesenSCG-928-D20]